MMTTKKPAPWHQRGDEIDAASMDQMRRACDLPIAVRGALMPDAHLGYGLPIGGVLATENAVIPYAVGVDIACRMKLSALGLPPESLETGHDRLVGAIEAETRFGIGASFTHRRQHPVMDEGLFRGWTWCRRSRKMTRGHLAGPTHQPPTIPDLLRLDLENSAPHHRRQAATRQTAVA